MERTTSKERINDMERILNEKIKMPKTYLVWKKGKKPKKGIRGR